MAYVYSDQREKLFTEQVIETSFKIRDNVNKLLARSGAFKTDSAFSGCTSDAWTMIAVLDYLVKKGEIREITGPSVSGQDRVFVRGGA